MENTSADRRTSSAPSSSGARCFFLSHHSIGEASARIEANEVSPKTRPSRKELQTADSFPLPPPSAQQTRPLVFAFPNPYRTSHFFIGRCSHTPPSTATTNCHRLRRRPYFRPQIHQSLRLRLQTLRPRSLLGLRQIPHRRSRATLQAKIPVRRLHHPRRGISRAIWEALRKRKLKLESLLLRHRANSADESERAASAAGYPA